MRWNRRGLLAFLLGVRPAQSKGLLIGTIAEWMPGWNRNCLLQSHARLKIPIRSFQRRFKQFPECGEAQRVVVYQRLEQMDHELDGHEFIANDRFTIADITILSRSTSQAAAFWIGSATATGPPSVGFTARVIRQRAARVSCHACLSEVLTSVRGQTLTLPRRALVLDARLPPLPGTIRVP